MQDQSDSHGAFSDRIEQLRLKLDGSMVAVAKRLDVSRTMLYDIKNGKVPVSPKMWRKLERAEAEQATGAAPQASEAALVLCRRIREEFYLPEDRDFAGLSPPECAQVLHAMGDAIAEMDRRKAAYAAKATRDGLFKPPAELEAARAELRRLDHLAAQEVNAGGQAGGQPAPALRRRAG